MGMSSILRAFCTVVLSTRYISPLSPLALLTVNLIQLTTPILVYGNVGSVLLFYLLEIFLLYAYLLNLLLFLFNLPYQYLYIGMSSILRGFCTVILFTRNISPLCLLAQLIVVLIQLTIPILVYGNV